MTWEETIRYIRTVPEHKQLVEFAYFDERLEVNVERFRSGEEFIETKRLINMFIPGNSAVRLLDIGSGNGISAVAFALEGMQVEAVEPDPSDTIGAGAIRKLKEHYKLVEMKVHQSFAEELKFPDNSFDVVYARQCMHHAHDLTQFVGECGRVLKKGGLLLTVRDHVVFDEADKKWFLESHPLQKYYGGENAFNVAEYKAAFINAGVQVKKVLAHFESVINHFPLSSTDKWKAEKEREQLVDSIVRKKLGALANLSFVKRAAKYYVSKKLGQVFDERKVPGRMYTFLSIKE
jgi:ubiquinone/menaquinone biosynthesis C-methylase UbiE